MRLLLLSKFGSARGGAERCFRDQVRWFRETGHPVAVVTQTGPSEEDPPGTRFDVRPVDFRSTLREGVVGVERMFWSSEVARAVQRAVATFRPHAAIVHNTYHHLGPAIPRMLRRLNVPTLMFVHDHKPVCPAYSAWRAGRVCRECNGRRFYRAALHACGGSTAHGVLLAAESYWQHSMLRTYDDIEEYVVPSHYMAAALAEGGLRGKVSVVRNAVEPISGAPNRDGFAVGFYGRLTPEKGVDTLLDAAKLLPEATFRIAGEGPARLSLQEQTRRLQLRNVEFVGDPGPDGLSAEFGRWHVSVVPSVSPENCPYAVLDAFRFGVPVVGTDDAGIRELVSDRGLLFPRGDHRSLAASIRLLLQDSSVHERCARRGLELVDMECRPETHIKRVLELLQARL